MEINRKRTDSQLLKSKHLMLILPKSLCLYLSVCLSVPLSPFYHSCPVSHSNNQFHLLASSKVYLKKQHFQDSICDTTLQLPWPRGLSLAPQAQHSNIPEAAENSCSLSYSVNKSSVQCISITVSEISLRPQNKT